MTQKQRQQYQTLQILVYALQLETWPFEEIDKPAAFAEVVKFAQILGITLDPTDPEFLPTVAEKIIQILSQPPEQPSPNLPPSEILEEFAQKEPSKYHQQTLKLIYPRLDKEIRRLQHQFAQKIHQQLVKDEPFFSQNPKLSLIVSENLAFRAVNNLPQTTRKEAFSEKEYQQVITKIKPSFVQELKKTGLEKPKIETDKNFIAKIATSTHPLAQQLATIPHTTIPLEKIVQVEKPPLSFETIPPLPKEVLVKINLPSKTVNFLPIFTLLHPKAMTAFVEKIIYTPAAKFLKSSQAEMTSEWQEMVEKGLFAEDIQASIKALREMGVPENHLVIQYLQDKAHRFQEQQKKELIKKDGTVILKDTPGARIFKHYYRFNKITGGWEIYDEKAGFNLPQLSPKELWRESGYADFLRQGLDKFQFITRISQRVIKFVTRGKYESLGIWFKKAIYPKLIKPILTRLGKTAVGKGIKKAAVWVAAKLGIKIAAKAGVAATGAATGPPGWVVAVAMFAVDILKFLGRKIVGLIQKIVREPEKALAAVGVGVLILIFVPMPFALIAIAPLSIGGIGLVSFATAPSTLSAVSGGISAFFTSVFAAPFTLPVALFVIILFSVLASLTLFIVMVVSGAFILPEKVEEAEMVTISPYVSEFFEITKTASPTHLENSALSSQPTITYKITITPKKGKKLIHTSIKEEITVSKEGAPINLSPHFFEEIKEISSPWVSEDYQITLDNRFKNSTIINTITVTTEVEGRLHKGITSAVVTIGKPPGDCPLIWPTTHGYITQGPESCYSHTHQEAIDIGVPKGTPVFATHKGVVTVGCDPGGGGNYVKISGTCRGVTFSSLYFHLQNISIKSGSTVVMGQQIGTSGATVNCSGGEKEAHLHYEFRPFGSIVKMAAPDVPKTVPRKCGEGYAVCDPNRPKCNISW